MTRRRGRWRAISAVTLLLVGGCTVGEESLPESLRSRLESPGRSTGEHDTPPALAPRPTPDLPGPPATSEPGPHGRLARCDGRTEAAVAEVIADQLEAFAADDWQAALRFASAGFRDSFDASGLESLITQDFPVVADNNRHLTLDCASDGEIGESQVVVHDAEGGSQTLRYLLRHEDGTWRIAGAVPEKGGALI